MTVKLLVVNADFYTGHNKALVQQCCEWCDVLALVEAKDFTVADFLPGGWTSLQDTGSEAEAGACLAVNGARVSVEESYQVLGCDEPKGGGMLRRYIAVAECHELATGKQFNPLVYHWPPERYQQECGPQFTTNLQGAWLNNKTRRPVAGCDANMPIKDMAKKLHNAKGYGTEVMGWSVWQGETVKVSDTVVRGGVKEWSDHPGYQINLTFS